MKYAKCGYTPEYLLMIFVPIVIVLWLITFLISDADGRRLIRIWISVSGTGQLLASMFSPEVFCKQVQVADS